MRLYGRLICSCAALLYLSGCARTYLKHPFLEQELNDKRYIADRKDFAGSIDIKRRRSYLPFARTRIYYNNRLIGQAGTKKTLTIYFDKGLYAVKTKGRHKITDTLNFTKAEVIHVGHGDYLKPIIVDYKTPRKLYINTIDADRELPIANHDRESQ